MKKWDWIYLGLCVALGCIAYGCYACGIRTGIEEQYENDVSISKSFIAESNG